MTQVFVTGWDNVSWASDNDLNPIRRAFEQFSDIELADLNSCDIVHSSPWLPSANIPNKKL